MNKLFLPGICFVLLTAGCVLGPAARQGGQESAPDPQDRPASRGESPGKGSPAGDLVFAALPKGEPPWEELPLGARSYLAELAEAFSLGDAAFLLAQGETQFETELRPHYDEGDYLALLYRAGSYLEDKPRNRAGRTRLRLTEIKRMEYTGWEERGPMLEVRGRLITGGGKNIPCLIVFNPRLRTPKLLGAYP
jgi:hypothetical protein